MIGETVTQTDGGRGKSGIDHLFKIPAVCLAASCRRIGGAVFRQPRILIGKRDEWMDGYFRIIHCGEIPQKIQPQKAWGFDIFPGGDVEQKMQSSGNTVIGADDVKFFSNCFTVKSVTIGFLNELQFLTARRDFSI